MKRTFNLAAVLLLQLPDLSVPREAAAGGPAQHLICISNERSGDVTIIDGGDRRVLATIPVGKRPRGIHASPDGRFLYGSCSSVM